MATRKKTPEQELDEEIEEELDDEWDDDGAQSPGAKLLRRFGEIRSRLLWVIGSIVVFSLIAGWFCVPIFDFLLNPLCSAIPQTGTPPPGTTAAVMQKFGGCGLYPIDLLEPFVVYFKVSVLIGFFASIPVIFYQLFKILSPYIEARIRNYAILFVTAASVMFIGGAAFGFYVVFPNAFAFMLMIAGNRVIPLPTMASYFEIVSMLLLGFGLSFELPLLMFGLSQLGVTNTKFYLRYWRHAVFVLLLFAAAITPTTDPFTMMALAGPLTGLYFLGIGLSWFGRRSGPTLFEKRLKELDVFLEQNEDDDDDDDEDDAAAEGAGA
jgi:sec-independent protein translocase protein TatC